jgi:hypothetical protein
MPQHVSSSIHQSSGRTISLNGSVQYAVNCCAVSLTRKRISVVMVSGLTRYVYFTTAGARYADSGYRALQFGLLDFGRSISSNPENRCAHIIIA